MKPIFLLKNIVSISSYDVITDKKKPKDGNDCTNFISKVDEITTKQKKNFSKSEQFPKRMSKFLTSIVCRTSLN